jgi:hypothetical protein
MNGRCTDIECMELPLPKLLQVSTVVYPTSRFKLGAIRPPYARVSGHLPITEKKDKSVLNSILKKKIKLLAPVSEE